MKKQIGSLILLSIIPLTLVAGVGDKAGGSKGEIIIKSMDVMFEHRRIPIHKTCLNRDNDLQAIESKRVLTTSRYYYKRVCSEYSSNKRDDGRCIQYQNEEAEYPDKFTIKKWKNTGRPSGRDKDDKVTYLGREKRELPYCD